MSKPNDLPPETICAVCGEPESEHHGFEPVERPSGCVCDPLEWGDPSSLPPVCAKFVGDPDNNCATCEHDKECHQ